MNWVTLRAIGVKNVGLIGPGNRCPPVFLLLFFRCAVWSSHEDDQVLRSCTKPTYSSNLDRSTSGLCWRMPSPKPRLCQYDHHLPARCHSSRFSGTFPLTILWIFFPCLPHTLLRIGQATTWGVVTFLSNTWLFMETRDGQTMMVLIQTQAKTSLSDIPVLVQVDFCWCLGWFWTCLGDDGICPKTTEGYGPLRNMTVYNTTIRSRSAAIKFGSATPEDFFDITFENITMFVPSFPFSFQLILFQLLLSSF